MEQDRVDRIVESALGTYGFECLESYCAAVTPVLAREVCRRLVDLVEVEVETRIKLEMVEVLNRVTPSIDAHLGLSARLVREVGLLSFWKRG